MFRILSKIADYFYIDTAVESNSIQSIEETSPFTDYEVVCRILGKKFCSDFSKSMEEIKETLFIKIFHEKISPPDVDKILKIIDLLPDERKKDLFYRDICEVSLQKKNLDQALSIITLIKDKYISSKLLEMLSLSLFEEGRLAESLKVVRSMPFDSTKAIILRKLCIEVAATNPSICFRIIDHFPESELSFKDGTLMELMHIFADRAASANNPREKLACNQLALRFGQMLEYRRF